MALNTLTVLECSRAGVATSYAAANADGSYFKNDGKVFLHVKNADAAPHTVTVTPTQKVLGQAIPAFNIAINAGAEAMIGPFPPAVFNDGNGNAQVTFSAVTAVTILAVHVP